MPIVINPGFASSMSNFKQKLITALTTAVKSTVDTIYAQEVRAVLNWGDDHELTHNIVVIGDQLVDVITIRAPRLRDRPEENQRLADEILPGIWGRFTAAIGNGIQNLTNRLLRGGE